MDADSFAIVFTIIFVTAIGLIFSIKFIKMLHKDGFYRALDDINNKIHQ